MKTLLIHSEKGGSGKTTLAVNAAVDLATRYALRTLLIDCDAQGHAGLHLGIGRDTARLSVLDVLLGAVPLAEAVLHTDVPGLDLLPAHEDLATLDATLAGRLGREHLLRDALEGAAGAYDVIVIDMSPSLGVAWANAALAADAIVIPAPPEAFGADGVAALVRHMRALERPLRHQFPVAAIVPTRVQRRRASAEIEADLRAAFGDLVTSPIRDSAKVPEAQSHGRDVLHYAPTSAPADELRAVVDQIATRVGIVLAATSATASEVH